MRWEVSINRPRSSSILNAEPILFKVVTLTKIIKCQLLSRFNKVFLKAWAHARKSPTELACLYHIRPKTLAPAFVEQMSAQEIPNQNLDFKGTVKWFYYTVCSKKVNPCKFCASSYWWWVCKYVWWTNIMMIIVISWYTYFSFCYLCLSNYIKQTQEFRYKVTENINQITRQDCIDQIYRHYSNCTVNLDLMWMKL